MIRNAPLTETGKCRNFDSDSGSVRCSSVDQADAPEEQKGDDHAVPRIHQVRRRRPWESAYSPSMKQPMKNGIAVTSAPNDHDHHQHGVEGAGPAPLVDQQPPAQPDECLQVLPVHEAASSSQLSLRVAS